MRSELPLLCLLALLTVGHCVPITIDPKNCQEDFGLYTWSPKRYGPYVICLGGTVTFRWTGLHGVFQIPDLACPSNFTSGETDTYKFLAPASNGGEFIWETPNKTGHYWATSSYGIDCQQGMVAEIYVVDPEKDQAFRASGLRASAASAVFLSIALCLLHSVLVLL